MFGFSNMFVQLMLAFAEVPFVNINMNILSPTSMPPRCSMYGLFTYIYHKFDLNVGKYTRHGSYGSIHQPKNPIGFQYTYESSSAAAHGMATI